MFYLNYSIRTSNRLWHHLQKKPTKKLKDGTKPLLTWLTVEAELWTGGTNFSMFGRSFVDFVCPDVIKDNFFYKTLALRESSVSPIMIIFLKHNIIPSHGCGAVLLHSLDYVRWHWFPLTGIYNQTLNVGPEKEHTVWTLDSYCYSHQSNVGIHRTYTRRSVQKPVSQKA